MKAQSHITAYHHGAPYRCRIVVEELPPAEDGLKRYKVCLFLPGNKTCEDTNSTLFNALVNIRRELEPQGWMLAINAARFDAMPGTEFNDVFIYLPDSPGVWHKTLALGEAPPTELAEVSQQTYYSEVMNRTQLSPQSKLRRGRKKWWRYITDSSPDLPDDPVAPSD